MTTAEARLARSATQAARSSCSTFSWRPASIVRRRSVAGHARLRHGRLVEHRLAARVALGDERPAARRRASTGSTARRRTGRSPSRLTKPAGARRGSSPGRRRPAGRPARVRVRGSGRRRAWSTIAARIWSAIVAVEAVAQDEVLRIARSSGRAARSLSASSSPRIRVSSVTVARRCSGVSWSDAATRRSRGTVVASTTVPGPVVDVAALAGRLEGDRRLGQRLRRPAARDRRPASTPAGPSARGEPTTKTMSRTSSRLRESVRPKHRSVDRLARPAGRAVRPAVRGPRRCPSLRIAGSRPSRLRSERTSAAASSRRWRSSSRRPMSSPVAETRTCWASEKKASMNATTMAPRTRPSRFVRRPARTRAADPPAIERSGPSAMRGAPRGGQDDGSRACALVDGHRSVAEHEADARTARIEEPERVGLGGRAPFAELEFEPFGMLATVGAARGPRAGGARRSCDGWTCGACSSRVLLLPFRGTRLRVARRPAVGHSGPVGWRRSRSPTGSATGW